MDTIEVMARMLIVITEILLPTTAIRRLTVREAILHTMVA